MVGTAASVNQTQKRFFGTHMSRSGILFGARWWSTFNRTWRLFASYIYVHCMLTHSTEQMYNFAWLQKVIRGEVLPNAPLTLDDYPLSDEVAQSISEDSEVTTSPTLMDMSQSAWPQDELGSPNLGFWRSDSQ
jgi:hypothetical protein